MCFVCNDPQDRYDAIDQTPDVVARAVQALKKLKDEFAASDEMFPLRLALTIEGLAEAIPELVSEIERLRGV